MPLYSLASNIQTYTVPGQVPEVNTFSVNPSGTNVELRWTNGGVTGSNVCVDYLCTGWTAYQNLGTFGENDTEYIFTPSARGNKITFKAYRKGNLGQSDPVYDYIYPPYRDSSQDSDVYITGVSCTQNPDSWFNGRPDFYVKIIEQSFSGDTLFVQKHVDLPVTSGLSASYGNKLGHKWSIRENAEKGWYSTLVFGLYESDYSAKVRSVKVEADLIKKDTLGLVPSIKASVEFSIGKYDEDCGSTYIRYFNNPTATLVFPNYGAKLTIDDKRRNAFLN